MRAPGAGKVGGLPSALGWLCLSWGRSSGLLGPSALPSPTISGPLPPSTQILICPHTYTRVTPNEKSSCPDMAFQGPDGPTPSSFPSQAPPGGSPFLPKEVTMNWQETSAGAHGEGIGSLPHAQGMAVMSKVAQAQPSPPWAVAPGSLCGLRKCSRQAPALWRRPRCF